MYMFRSWTQSIVLVKLMDVNVFFEVDWFVCSMDYDFFWTMYLNDLIALQQMRWKHLYVKK